MESVMEKHTHRLGWCDPGQARFWNLEEPSHRCPETLGRIICACPCHQGIACDQVNRADREEAERRTRRLARSNASSESAPKRKRKRVIRKAPS